MSKREWFFVFILFVFGLVVVYGLDKMDKACEAKGGKLVQGHLGPVCVKPIEEIKMENCVLTEGKIPKCSKEYNGNP